MYLNNCVGHGNHSHFVWFLFFAVVGCTHAAIILICSLYAGLYRDYYVYYQLYSYATVKLTTWSLIFTVFNIGLSIGVVIAVGMLLFFQLKSILKNSTGIEDWIIDKAIYRRKAMLKAAREAGDENFEVEPFVYPYDLGRIKNFAQVVNFSCLPIGDGVTWPVVDGCDQYTLTVSTRRFFDTLVLTIFNFRGNNLHRNRKNAREHVDTKSFRRSPAAGCHCGLRDLKFVSTLH